MTRKIFTCTCQAISRDNLENWPIYLVQELLPRHLQIIFEINQQHLDSIRKFGNKDLEVLRELSLVEEGEVKRIRMSHLALICTSKFNGVSIAQTQALKDKVFYPAVENNVCAFSTVTDGIDLRRWMLGANRALPTLITDAIGPKWMKSPQELIKLIDYCDDSEFLFRIEEAKYAAKKRFAYFYQQKCGISVEPGFFFDVQACRIHPSRRQALHILSILDRYLKIKKGEDFGFPRLHIFAGKASPSDHLAKQNILLINIVADLINADSAVADKLRVAFVPDYGMSWAEYLVPAADLAEYLTTPGLQASSSSILPFAVNGAAVIHSKAGLYTELSQRMGPGNIITFGKTLAELQALKGYSAWDERSKNERLRAIFEFLEQNLSSIPNGTGLYPLLSTLSDSDQNFVLLDFDEYIAQQEAIDGYFLDKTGWVGRGIKNIANSGWFSCDNTVESYVKDIWNIEAIK
jgi:starch phosphorylase